MLYKYLNLMKMSIFDLVKLLMLYCGYNFYTTINLYCYVVFGVHFRELSLKKIYNT